MNKADKLNIFWIEDNPKQTKLKVIDGLKFPSFDLNSIENTEEILSFKLFQHPVEVKEYLSMIYELNEKGLSARLCEKCCAALPDIVVFDYKLSDNFSTRNPKALQYSNDNELSFLENHSASLEMKKAFKEEFLERVLFIERKDVKGKEKKYNGEEFKDEISAKTVDKLDDEFGLYSGIAIVREFKDFITLGVPATFNKVDTSKMTENSLFYEWLNSYDIKDAIQRPDKGSKDWDDILKFALPLLRDRIENQIKSGKIIPDYKQLVNLVQSNTTEEAFSFQSAYGERHLPLEALFIDKTETVSEWASGILTNLPVDNEVIARAKEVGKLLWEVYKNEFGKRIDLAEYCYRENELDTFEQKEFDRLKNEFVGKTGKFGKEISILELLADYKQNNSTLRLTTLYVAASGNIAMNSCKKHSPARDIYNDFDEYEYFNMLFPKVLYKDYKFLLPMHIEGKDQKSRMIDNKGAKTLERQLLGDKKSKKMRWYDFGIWIEEGEKQVLRMILYKHQEHFPVWLK